jgi:uncharacterized protein with PIN domain
VGATASTASASSARRCFCCVAEYGAAGLGLPAGLHFGDCFTYALAEQTGHPALCTGDDFAATDITVVGSRPAPPG